MSCLILVRHSHVAPESTGPDTDWPLSPQGRDLCAALADALQPYQPHLLVSSTMRRAHETAQLTAARLGIDWRPAEGLEEHRRPYVPGGRRPQDDFEATMQRFFATPAERVFGQESADEARQRFTTAVDSILAEEPGRNVAIVSHGTVLALYAAPFFDLQPVDLWRRISWPSFLVIDTATQRGLHITDTLPT